MISIRKLILTTITRRYSQVQSIKRNPGIKKRKAVLDQETDAYDVFGNMELDDLESDFMGAHKSYKEHLREVDGMKEQLKYQIVKQKYFKEKYPNFLTWSDKEQIKLLHNKDPEEWTVEKLSESFPALPDVVRKILKSQFSKSESKIRNHDTSVQKNWNEFKQGSLTIPPELAEHLNKFTSREMNHPFQGHDKEVYSNNPQIEGPFSSIISSYAKLKNKTTNNGHEENSLDIKNKSTDNETYFAVKKKHKKPETIVTLPQLQENIKEKAIAGCTLTQDEQILYETSTKSKENLIELKQDHIQTISENKYNKSSGSLMTTTSRDYSHLIYPEKISIPKELRKRGYTYRVNDCYYDWDGVFLYRVPGMC